MEEFVNLRKGNKVIKRTRANYEANEEHWTNRGYSLTNNKPHVKKIIEKTENIIKLKPKKKTRKKK